MMRMNRVGKPSAPCFGHAASALLLLAGLTCMVGCQGVSAASSGPTQSGSLALGSLSVNFGNVTAGGSKTLTVTATNSGTKSVTISSASVSTKYFSVTAPSLPAAIGAGQSTTLSMNFTPNAAGSFSATVTIDSDASNAVTNLSLSGTGVGNGQLALNPTSQAFGSVAVGAKASATVTLTNNGGSSVNISQASVSGTGFQLSGITAPVTLNTSQSTTFTVTFGPQTTGSVSGAVTITSDATNPTLTLALSGTGISPGALGSNPTSFSFGSVSVGSKQTLSETVTNTGSSSVTVSSVGVSGSGFGLSGITAPMSLAAGQSATFSVSFAPQSAGAVSGNVTIGSTASNPTLTIPLSGTGTTTVVGQLTASPATLGLGSVVVGTSGTATGSLTASGASVTVTAASANNSVFSVGGLSLPVTIPAGQSAPFTVTFSPQVTGAAGAALSFTSNAQPSTTTEALTGTGTPAPVHTVNLSWNASTSSNISGYNIYRAVFTTSCGSYAKINSVLDTSTLYSDSAVIDGTAYCYGSTAVNTSNQESGYSNIVSNIQIPPP
ncbi:MAG: choice-of-anchor D domain-containing protein [Candidatus Sulfotelmatobacter sp.]